MSITNDISEIAFNLGPLNLIQTTYVAFRWPGWTTYFQNDISDIYLYLQVGLFFYQGKLIWFYSSGRESWCTFINVYTENRNIFIEQKKAFQ